LQHVYDFSPQAPRWRMGGKHLDAREACEIVWTQFSPFAANLAGVVLTVPAYLHAGASEALGKLGLRVGLPVLGSVPTLLGAAIAAHADERWQRSGVVIDWDDHALSLGWVKGYADKVQLVESRAFPQMAMAHLRERLLDTLAEMFVMQHRRDPRDAPHAEQSLFDQLDPLIDAAAKHQSMQLGVHGKAWYKHLLVHPEQTLHCCAPYVRHAVREIEALVAGWPAGETPRSLLLTHDAARMPGLIDALHALVLPTTGAETKLPVTKFTNYLDEEDFGDALMMPDASEPGGLIVLPPDAAARAAHGLADLFRRGLLPRGHVETMAPSSRSQESGVRGQVSKVPGRTAS
jgi:hypothetical protein